MTSRPEVALVLRGDHATRDSISLKGTRLEAVADALSERGLEAVPVVYSEEISRDVRQRLNGVAAAQVWVDPVVGDRDRSDLDSVLRDVASAGVFVSAHPDTILRMGTKEILHVTRALGWGSEVRLYRALDELASGLPESLATGPRVLKQYRGNGGIGVWKATLLANDMVRVQSARARDTKTDDLTMADFIARSAKYFNFSYGEGRLVDQPFQPRIVEGMIRCYCVRDQVVGFARQYPHGLSPAEKESGVESPPADLVLGLPAAKTMFSPDEPQFQRLRRLMETDWVPGLMRLAGIEPARLPVLWDADFLYGMKDGSGEDAYVLCEINCSAVSPFPPEAVPKVADALAAAAGVRTASQQPIRNPG